ncbi:zonadhesin-like isoform X2 [Varroa destructor]|uniref:Uncharacterized protein n=1 Tax=Varroa destructor TaxID=109461 RepID=A0A7M7KD98_VARDE|nr:zonadhesin-like isoform X2 [Varroa destructor]
MTKLNLTWGLLVFLFYAVFGFEAKANHEKLIVRHRPGKNDINDESFRKFVTVPAPKFTECLSHPHKEDAFMVCQNEEGKLSIIIPLVKDKLKNPVKVTRHIKSTAKTSIAPRAGNGTQIRELDLPYIQEGNADGEETTLDEYATLDPWTLEPDSKPLRTMNVSTKEFLPKDSGVQEFPVKSQPKVQNSHTTSVKPQPTKQSAHTTSVKSQPTKLNAHTASVKPQPTKQSTHTTPVKHQPTKQSTNTTSVKHQPTKQSAHNSSVKPEPTKLSAHTGSVEPVLSVLNAHTTSVKPQPTKLNTHIPSVKLKPTNQSAYTTSKATKPVQIKNESHEKSFKQEQKKESLGNTTRRYHYTSGDAEVPKSSTLQLHSIKLPLEPLIENDKKVEIPKALYHLKSTSEKPYTSTKRSSTRNMPAETSSKGSPGSEQRELEDLQTLTSIAQGINELKARSFNFAHESHLLPRAKTSRPFTEEGEGSARFTGCRTSIIMGDFRQLICENNLVKGQSVHLFLHQNDDPIYFQKFIDSKGK